MYQFMNITRNQKLLKNSYHIYENMRSVYLKKPTEMLNTVQTDFLKKSLKIIRPQTVMEQIEIQFNSNGKQNNTIKVSQKTLGWQVSLVRKQQYPPQKCLNEIL